MYYNLPQCFISAKIWIKLFLVRAIHNCRLPLTLFLLFQLPLFLQLHCFLVFFSKFRGQNGQIVTLSSIFYKKFWFSSRIEHKLILFLSYYCQCCLNWVNTCPTPLKPTYNFLHSASSKKQYSFFSFIFGRQLIPSHLYILGTLFWLVHTNSEYLPTQQRSTFIPCMIKVAVMCSTRIHVQTLELKLSVSKMSEHF